jgi:hypothetical protein
MEDYDNDELYGEERYGEERGYYERVSKQTGFVAPEDVKNLSEEEKMFRNINITVNKLNKILDDKIGNQDIEKLKETPSLKIGDSLKYRNLTAYTLGYYCTKIGNKISKKKIKELKDVLDENKHEFLEGIAIEDILRYSNYWIKYLSEDEEDV